MKVSSAELEAALHVAAPGGVDFSVRRRAEYSADASNYRRLPVGVVFPRTRQELIDTVKACYAAHAPVTLRGAGTSVAGNSIGSGVVIDTSRYYNRVISIDPESRTAVVEPGIVLDDLQKAAAVHGLRFGPDPSTHSRCTIGGMIGNNACGARSLIFGRTVDNVLALDVLTVDGLEMTLSPRSLPALQAKIHEGGREGSLLQGIHQLVSDNASLIAAKMGRFDRQISGYSLEHLLPVNGFNLAKAIVGTEGTCAVILRATLQLVEAPKHHALVVLGFDELAAAGDAVTRLPTHRPTAIEGMDSNVVEMLRRHRPDAVPPWLLPEGDAWLLVEFSGDSPEEVAKRANTLLDDLIQQSGAISGRAVASTSEQKRLWRIREDGAGLASRTPDGNEAWPGWEDASVPPEKLGDYLRGFLNLLAHYGRHGAVYGHFGEGCIHTRIDFDFDTPQGVEQFRAFISDACKLAVSFGGSYSGEHGDGFARSEFLPMMYGDELVSVFEQFKKLWDPDGLLNPGVVVEPERMDDHLRVDPTQKIIPVNTVFLYPHDDGEMAKGVRRCVGVGKCRADQSGVMCPSYRATRDEKDSTRGRARVLHEMLIGESITDGWQSKEALEALDLCLSCKGCKSDCPVNVDMATYKSEFLHQHYKGKIRPVNHYSMGWFPVWARLASYAPRVANLIAASPLGTIGKHMGGIAEQRPVPKFATETFRAWFEAQNFQVVATRGDVMLWPDTFTNHISPQIGIAAVKVLHHAGFRVVLPDERACCGVTWISTGQLDQARKALQASVAVISGKLIAGVPMVVLEPSCAAVFRSDLVELLGDSPVNRAVQANTLTLAELLDRDAPDLVLPAVDAKALMQVHCHQHAVLGSGADARVMQRLGIDTTVLDKGCCGLAGNFGYERDHYDVSVAVAEQGPLPAIREADAKTLIVTDGYSCRTQFAHLSECTPLHLAQVIADALGQ